MNKNRKISNIESLMSESYKARPAVQLDAHWQNEVMASVRILAAKSAMTATRTMLFPIRFMARFAMGSIAIAIICAVVYLSNSSSTSSLKHDYATDLPYSTFENSLNMVASL